MVKISGTDAGRAKKPERQQDPAAALGYFPSIVRPKAAAIGPLIQATFQRAHAAGAV